MCARYTMATAPDELIEEFEATLVADALPARYNVTPTTEAPIVVASKEGERRLGLSRFGLIPHWAKDAKIGARLLNARSESAAEKPAFRDAFRKRRCLVIADGFYEWRREGKQKIPHHFHLEGSGEAMKPFACTHSGRDAAGRSRSLPKQRFISLSREFKKIKDEGRF